MDRPKRRGKASACTQCQRRKQKCNREWPCNHCQARRISHLCQFAAGRAAGAANSAINRTRSLSPGLKESAVKSEEDDLARPDISAVAGEEVFRVLGYLPNDHNLPGGGARVKKSNGALNGVLSAEMESALRAIPPKPYTDILVQNFLIDTNYQYYLIYPPTFSHEYSLWWADRSSGRKLTPEFTCLLLRVCALSTQYLNVETREKLELELGESAQRLTERYHHAAQQLSINIRPGKGGLTQVQQLMLAASWFKSEAMFTESWHTLGSAIHEAQELGMHKISSIRGITEFDREMRRRIWCVVYTWDWQTSVMLSRPLIINHSCCSLEMPNLQLESAPDTDPDLPSPIAPMALQAQLARTLSKIPGVTDDILPAEQVVTVQQEIEKWFASFPPAYKITNPDTQWDGKYRYVALQRCQLHATGLMILFHSLKPYLTRNGNPDMSDMEMSLRAAAVDCSLKLLGATRRLFDGVFPVNAKFHFVIFVNFDTAAALCSAIFHDPNRSLPRRDKVIEAIRLFLNMMERLSHMTKMGAICYASLIKLVSNLPLSSEERTLSDSACPESSDASPKFLGAQQTLLGHDDISSKTPMPSRETLQNGVYTPPLLGEMETSLTMDLSDLPHMDIGELGQLWDWNMLDLNFSVPPAV